MSGQLGLGSAMAVITFRALYADDWDSGRGWCKYPPFFLVLLTVIASHE